MATEENVSTLFVGNLPPNYTTQELETLFSDVGPIKRCFVVKSKGGSGGTAARGFGYVTYALREDAEIAIKKIKSVGRQSLNIKFAKRRVRPDRNEKGEENDEVKGKPMKREKTEKRQHKNGRLIVRNLSFKAKEDDVNKQFSKFGKISEIVIPKGKGGRECGFCFIQFTNVKNAAEAMKEINGKEILGRCVAVDWALPKDKYLAAVEPSTNEIVIKEEVESVHEDCEPQHQDDDVIKVEPVEDDDSSHNSEDDINVISSEEEDDEDQSDDEDDNDDDDEEDDDDDEEDDDDDEEEDSVSGKRKLQKRKSDVNEGKTLFLRNLTFDTTENDLKSTFQEFGKLKYAKLCIDPDTEHPKGTAFIQFEEKNSAEECLQKACDEEEGGGIFVQGRRLNVSIAVTREELAKKWDEKHKKVPSDNRNLYLAREGLIRVGSQAAEGVSASDMQKRAKLEIWKREKLKKLNFFISKYRLCVRNLPENVKDDKLRQIVLSAAGSGASITECRIIRKPRSTTVEADDPSKGFGFVTFTTHEHALQVLRKLNNNPTIFSRNHRPIVEFSIEDRNVMNARMKRLQKSKEKLGIAKKGAENSAKKGGGNPTKKGTENPTNKGENSAKKNPANLVTKGKFKETKGNNQQETAFDSLPFVGARGQPIKVNSKIGARGGMPSHMGPKIRHKKRPGQMLAKKLKKQRKLNRTKRSLGSGKKELVKMDNVSSKRNLKRPRSDSRLSKIEESYRTKRRKLDKMMSGKRKTKWFDD